MTPKRRRSGFVLYSQEQRPILKEREPGLTFGQLSSRMGQAWKELSSEERAIYEQKARERRNRGGQRR
jgi:hypothetical protein